MLTIHAYLHSMAGFCDGQGAMSLLAPEISDIKYMLAALKIPAWQTGIILMDKKPVSLDDKLRDGAIIDIYPIIAGG